MPTIHTVSRSFLRRHGARPLRPAGAVESGGLATHPGSPGRGGRPSSPGEDASRSEPSDGAKRLTDSHDMRGGNPASTGRQAGAYASTGASAGSGRSGRPAEKSNGGARRQDASARPAPRGYGYDVGMRPPASKKPRVAGETGEAQEGRGGSCKDTIAPSEKAGTCLLPGEANNDTRSTKRKSNVSPTNVMDFPVADSTGDAVAVANEMEPERSTNVPSVPYDAPIEGHVVSIAEKVKRRKASVEGASAQIARGTVPAAAAKAQQQKRKASSMEASPADGDPSEKKGGRWHTVSTLNPKTGRVENTGRWTAEEHGRFLRGLEQHGKGSWDAISALVGSRNASQVRSYSYSLKPHQKGGHVGAGGESAGQVGEGVASSKDPVATQQDASAKKGRWQTTVTKTGRGQTTSTVDLRTGRVKNTGRWTAEEESRFLRGLDRHGRGAWGEIAALIGSRNAHQTSCHAVEYFRKQAKAAADAERVEIEVAAPEHELQLEHFQGAVDNVGAVQNQATAAVCDVVANAEAPNEADRTSDAAQTALCTTDDKRKHILDNIEHRRKLLNLVRESRIRAEERVRSIGAAGEGEAKLPSWFATIDSYLPVSFCKAQEGKRLSICFENGQLVVSAREGLRLFDVRDEISEQKDTLVLPEGGDEGNFFFLVNNSIISKKAEHLSLDAIMEENLPVHMVSRSVLEEDDCALPVQTAVPNATLAMPRALARHATANADRFSAKTDFDKRLKEHKTLKGYQGVEIERRFDSTGNHVRMKLQWDGKSMSTSLEGLLLSEAALGVDYSLRLLAAMRSLSLCDQLEVLWQSLVDPPAYVTGEANSDEMVDEGATATFNFSTISFAESERSEEIEKRNLANVDIELTNERKLILFRAVVNKMKSVVEPAYEDSNRVLNLIEHRRELLAIVKEARLAAERRANGADTAEYTVVQEGDGLGSANAEDTSSAASPTKKPSVDAYTKAVVESTLERIILATIKPEHDKLLAEHKALKRFRGVFVQKNKCSGNAVRIGMHFFGKNTSGSIDGTLLSEAALGSDFAMRLHAAMASMSHQKRMELLGHLSTHPPMYVACLERSIPGGTQQMLAAMSGAKAFNFPNPSLAELARRDEIRSRKLSDVSEAFTYERKLAIFQLVVKKARGVLLQLEASRFPPAAAASKTVIDTGVTNLAAQKPPASKHTNVAAPVLATNPQPPPMEPLRITTVATANVEIGAGASEKNNGVGMTESAWLREGEELGANAVYINSSAAVPTAKQPSVDTHTKSIVKTVLQRIIHSAIKADHDRLLTQPAVAVAATNFVPQNPATLANDSKAGMGEPLRGTTVATANVQVGAGASEKANGAITTLDDGRAFIVRVKESLSDRPDIFREFLNLSKHLKNKEVDKVVWARRALALLKGHTDLLLGLFSIALSDNIELEADTLEWMTKSLMAVMQRAPQHQIQRISCMLVWRISKLVENPVGPLDLDSFLRSFIAADSRYNDVFPTKEALRAVMWACYQMSGKVHTTLALPMPSGRPEMQQWLWTVWQWLSPPQAPTHPVA